VLQIDNTIISLDVFEKKFKCDLSKCRGKCCVYGDSGAPLEKDEVKLLEEIYPEVKPFLRPEGIMAIEEQGTSMVDSDGDDVTPLINHKECAYTIIENGIYFCAIESAYLKKKIKFQKPISCHLFPVRTKDYPEFTAVNYEKWEICKDAVKLGHEEDVSVVDFLKQALIRKFGKKWYKKLIIASKELKKSQYFKK
jgi:hypothetical protein